MAAVNRECQGAFWWLVHDLHKNEVCHTHSARRGEAEAASRLWQRAGRQQAEDGKRKKHWSSASSQLSLSASKAHEELVKTIPTRKLRELDPLEVEPRIYTFNKLREFPRGSAH